jgi:serine/threonine protein kinase/Tol biopolymer transport system component
MKPERWDEVDKILQSALERAPTERGAYLDAACKGDEQLRREVLTLLGSHESADSFMRTPAIESFGEDAGSVQKLKAGDSIGQYRIKRPIGRGGMGEVYLAEHTGQNRFVALKVLPEHFLSHEQRIERFQQEARAVLALNHPNVVTVYDIGEAAGVHFISTEFVEGQTLRERMARERLTAGEAVEIASQVAGALAYAHDRGVIHRDVKPENIMLRPDGYVKVLDFGIAKLTEARVAATPDDDPHEARTRMRIETSPGMVMGTAHYMSPEQARGKEVDERTDTWSLGVVLYEMLTGRQPFDGETPSDIIGVILQRDPAPLSALTPDVPAELERIVAKALDKSKDERYQTAKDFQADLRRFKRHHEHQADIERSMTPGEGARLSAQVSAGGQQASATGAGESNSATAGAVHTTSSAEYIVGEFKRHRKGVLVTLVAFVVVMVAGLVSYKLWSRGKASQSADAGAVARAARITPLPINGDLADTNWSKTAISPDGKYVVYGLLRRNAKGETENSVWEMYLPTGDVKQILPPSTKDAYGGFSFTNDGDYVYYWDGSQERNQISIYKVSLIGGVPKKLIDNSKALDFVPSPDGKQLAFMRMEGKFSQSLYVANEDSTGERLLATREGNDEVLEGTPAWSPDGKSLVCFLSSAVGGVHRSLLIVNVADGTQKVLDTARWFYLRSVVWLHDGGGLLVSAREFRQAPIQVWYVSYPDGATHRVTNDLNDYVFTSATADSKTLLAVQGKLLMDVWVTPAGGGDASQPPKQVTFTRSDGRNGIAWTPDGKLVVGSTAGGHGNLWVMNADGSDRRQITSGTEQDYYPAVSPDGRVVFFTSVRNGGIPNIWRVNMDGSNLKQLTFGTAGGEHPYITPDGKRVIFTSFNAGKITPWIIPADGGEPIQLSDKQMRCYDASPDSKQVVCNDLSEGEGLNLKIALLPVEGGGPAKVIEAPVKFFPDLGWTPDGSAITLGHYQDSGTNIWTLPLDGGPPKPLTNFNDPSLREIYTYALARDGKRLAVVRSNSTSDLVLISDFR